MSLEPYELGRGHIGLAHPRGECGRRFVPGSRRPRGVTPEVCANMSSRGDAETLDPRDDGDSRHHTQTPLVPWLAMARAKMLISYQTMNLGVSKLCANGLTEWMTIIIEPQRRVVGLPHVSSA